MPNYNFDYNFTKAILHFSNHESMIITNVIIKTVNVGNTFMRPHLDNSHLLVSKILPISMIFVSITGSLC